MTSLYEVLGARASDDAQAIKRAFRAAVKANHPDLHPGDPEAELRFRRIVTANAILRDAKQRAAYDQLLGEQERQVNAKQDQERLQHRRRQTRRKMRAAATIVCALSAGACGLFLSMPRTAVVAVTENKAPPVQTASNVETTNVETTKKDTAAAAASPAAAPKDENASDAAPTEATTSGEGSGSGSASMAAAREEEAAGPPVRSADAPTGTQVMAGAAAGVSDSAPGQGAAPFVPDRDGADKGDVAALASHEPPPFAKDANFYRERGTVSYRTGDFPSAIVNLNEAIKLDPKDVRAYNTRGNAWDEIGVFEKALADYNEAIRLDPDNPLLFHDRAIMWHRRGNLDKALADLDQATRFSAADPNLYCDRGLIWYEKGSHARAIADFSHAIKLDPHFASACISRGLILHRNSEFNVAFADIKKTIRVSPSVFDIKKQHLASHP